MPHCLG